MIFTNWITLIIMYLDFMDFTTVSRLFFNLKARTIISKRKFYFCECVGHLCLYALDLLVKEISKMLRYFLSLPMWMKFDNFVFFVSVTDSKQKLLTPQLNHISMMMQPFPLLPARDLIKEGAFCNESTVSNCTMQHCECTHVVKVMMTTTSQVQFHWMFTLILFRLRSLIPN